jgi:Tfp pilus assembly major pilin PilA
MSKLKSRYVKGSTLVEVIISLVIVSIVSGIVILMMESVFFFPKEVVKLKAFVISNNIKNEIKLNQTPIEIIVDETKNYFPDYDIKIENGFENGSMKTKLNISFNEKTMIKEEILLNELNNLN